jgi:hypothetical protein
MAAILDRCIDRERGDAIAATALAMGEVPALREFVVKVKRKTQVRVTLSVMGTDSVSVAGDHECLCEAGEYVDVQPRRFGFSEAELIEADLAYLHGVKQRDARRLREAHQLDVDAMRRAGL